MYKATISLPSIASEVSAAARLQFSKAAMLFSDDAIKRSVLISGNPLSPALAELYLRGLWSARPSGWFDRQLVANGTFDQEPVGLLPSIGFHYKMDRILLESDVDVQYVGSCAPFVRPQILEKPAGRAALKKFQNTLDLASVVLAGNAECAVQLQRYFAVDSESIIVLPVLPRLHKFKTPGQVNGLGKFNLIYLPAGPKSLRVKDVKTIKNEFRRIALDDPLVVTWDEGFGRPNSKWGTAFTA